MICLNRLNTLFNRQEQEDWNRISGEIKTEICREFSDPEAALETLRKYVDMDQKMQWEQFLKYIRQHWRSFLNFSIEQAWIRTETEFSIRKHTTCQIPYYHSHDFYELIYVYSGTCSQYLNGEDSELILQAGEVCVLTPGIIHAILPCASESLVFKLVIPSGDMNRILTAMRMSINTRNTQEEYCGDPKWNSLAEILPKQNELLVFRLCEDSAALEPLICGLLEESMEERPYGDIVLQNLLNLLLIRLARYGMEERKPDLLQEITSYIRKNLRSASFQELAGEMGYSTRHLSRRIQEKTGGTFSDILQRVRLEEAAVLLRETELTVEQIAERTGYQSVSGIYKRFRAVFHMTPNEYRKKGYRG